jgi:MoaA/NifB/PqqE/SkfB family radical SAM enzyme
MTQEAVSTSVSSSQHAATRGASGSPEVQALVAELASVLARVPALPQPLPRFGLTLLAADVSDDAISLAVGLNDPIAWLDFTDAAPDTPDGAIAEVAVREVNAAARRFPAQLAQMGRRLRAALDANRWARAKELARRVRAQRILDAESHRPAHVHADTRCPDGVANATPDGPPLLLNLTYFCNAKCPFCMVYDALNRPELTMEEDEAMENMRAARLQGSNEVGYSGGEPTVHPRFLDLVRYAKSLGYQHQQVSTNGIRWKSASFCREAIEAGVTSIDISIHGHTDELHDALVARKGALAAIRKACENLRALRADPDFGPAHPFYLGCSVVVTSENAPHLLAINRFLAEELGIGHIRMKYAYVSNTSRRQALVELVSPYQELVPYLIEADDYLAQRGPDFCHTHVPMCLVGDHLVFSKDFEQRTTIMAFHERFEVGDPPHRNRLDADVCDTCAVRNLCTRLDVSYEDYHGNPGLTPLSHQDLEAAFARAKARYPRRVPQIESAWRQYLANHGTGRHEWERHQERLHTESDP